MYSSSTSLSSGSFIKNANKRENSSTPYLEAIGNCDNGVSYFTNQRVASGGDLASDYFISSSVITAIFIIYRRFDG